MSNTEYINFNDDDTNAHSVKKVIDTLKNSSLNFGNYREFVANVKSQRAIINNNITGLQSRFRKLTEQYNELYEDPRTREEMTFNPPIVRKELFMASDAMFDNIRDAYGWKYFDSELLHVAFEKIAVLLGEIKAAEIQGETLKHMREMTNDVIKTGMEVLDNKKKTIELIFTSEIRELMKQQAAERRDMLDVFGDLVREIQRDSLKNTNLLADIAKRKQKLSSNESYARIPKYEETSKPVKKEVTTDVIETVDDVEDTLEFKEDDSTQNKILEQLGKGTR